jgi:ribosomal protein S10
LVYYEVKKKQISSIYKVLLKVVMYPICHNSKSVHKVKVKTFDFKTLNSFLALFLQGSTYNLLNVNLATSTLPVKRNIITVLRSPFVYKKTREQFLKKTYGITISILWGARNVMVNDYIIKTIIHKLKFFIAFKIELIETICKN